MSSQPVVPRGASGSASATSKPRQAPARGSSCGIPRERRIRKRADFQAVYHRGVRLGCRLFTVFVLATGSGGPSRMGLTATRKIGNAVARNRCKRVLREAVRKHWDLLPSSVDLVLNARHGLEAAKAGDVETEIVRMLRKAGRRLKWSVRASRG